MRFNLPKDVKKLMVLPLLLLIFSIIVLANHQLKTGFILEKSIDFVGGTQAFVSLNRDVSIDKVKEEGAKIAPDINVRTAKSVTEENLIFETKQELSKEQVELILKEVEVDYKEESISISRVGASLGASFLKQAESGILLAFVLMILAVFIAFRSLVPSAAVISAAVGDILFALAMMNIFNIDLSLATLASILMLIGYSIDTDVVLTTRVLKRRSEGNLEERIMNAMRTGLMMTGTAIMALLVLIFVSGIEVLQQMALVIIFGLLADVITTWFGNVAILRWYLKGKE